MISLSTKFGTHRRASIAGWVKNPASFAAVIALTLLFFVTAASADGATPSLEEMWKIIQQQQAEIE